MDTPDFLDVVPRIRLRDPLAEFLGAATGGVLEYGYVDAVKLAGHSCPTVASAYWLTRQALRALYGNDLPERGAVRVELAADIGEASERREFGRLWQDRVRRLLLEHAEDPAVFVVRETCAHGRAGP